MITHTVKLTVPDGKAEDFYNFMINPTSERYRQWWPGEHLEFYIVKHGDENHLGDLVFVDEYLGDKRRLTFHGKVVKARPPVGDDAGQIIWQMRKLGLALPAYLSLVLKDTSDGLLVKHQLRIGYKKLKCLDPFIKLYFSKGFQADLEKHCRLEWSMLARMLNNED